MTKKAKLKLILGITIPVGTVSLAFTVLMVMLVMYFVVPPTKEKRKTSDYQYIYDVVKDWNKVATPGYSKTTLLTYGEYMYNSYLLLVPRETPNTLTNFYFRWRQLMDVDNYGIYFTCELDEQSFLGYKSGLESFTVNVREDNNSLLFDDESFEYPAYIVQWLCPTEKWEVLEYIMLDESNHTVVYVYTMGCLEKIDNNSSYSIMPKVDVKNVVPNEKYNIDEGFSVYFMSDVDDSYYHIYPTLDELEFDNSFLRFLF